MKFTRRPRRPSGFTLLELLIASTVALVVFAAALGAGISLQKVNTDQQALMEIQTSLRFSEDILVRELEKAGSGFAQVAIMAFNQAAPNLSRARLALTIADIAEGDGDAACQSRRCSLLTILSGEIEKALQLDEINGNTLTVIGGANVVAQWTQNENFIQSFLLVDARNSAQCLFENVPRGMYEPSAANPNQLRVGLVNLNHAGFVCALDNFTPGNAFIIPLRETLFMTDGFQINDAWAFIEPESFPDRLKYIPNRLDATFTQEGHLRWLTLSREMESLNILYTIFNDANPMNARRRINDPLTDDDKVGIMTFDPTEITSQSDIDNIINSKNLLPKSDASAEQLMAQFDANQPERFTIPLLRRISQIQVELQVRKACRDADPSRCTNSAADRDQDGYQIRTLTTRINPNNLALISLNEFIH